MPALQNTKRDTAPYTFLLNPFRTAYRSTGFDKASYIYLSRLVSVSGRFLDDQRGKVIDEMPQIRDLLEAALGIGQGTCLSGGAASGSLRGRLLEFSAAAAEESDTGYCVAVCEPRYSAEQRYVSVVPIYGRGFEASAGDLVVRDAPWLSDIGGPAEAILAPSLVFSVFYPTQISRPLSAVIDAASMNAVDAALRRHFGL